MFDYPLPQRRAGLYEQLELGPEASSEEISEARQEVASRLQNQKAALRRQLDAVYQQVDGLREVSDRMEQLEARGSDADPKEYRTTQVRLAELEDQAAIIEPQFRSLRCEATDVEARIHAVNLMPLQNPEERLKYDRENPPFELIKLADCSSSPLDDSRTVLALIREEVADFLEQSGESVYHPSDLTREDFAHDFTYDATLDGNR